MKEEERFSVVYRLTGTKETALAMAKDICLEQTVEFPAELLPPGFISEQVVGRIEDFRPGTSFSHAVISYAVDTTAYELTQLLNVVFGNISIKPGIYVERIHFSESLLSHYRGPRFGRDGLRELVGVYERPLLFTALKPMGLSAKELAELAYKCALGGIDIIKDDHGLSDQRYAPFHERVQACVEAVRQANRRTGRQSIYVANVTADSDTVLKRAHFAKQAGAGGLMLSPALSGFAAIKRLADDDTLALPIFSHPAFLGSYVMGKENGISQFALLGQITRLAGADAVIYPNFGGRFSFSREECQEIVDGSEAVMGQLNPMFPAPGGGLQLENIPSLRQVYGKDVIYLIGGGLFKHGPDIVKNCQMFKKLVEDLPEGDEEKLTVGRS